MLLPLLVSSVTVRRINRDTAAYNLWDRIRYHWSEQTIADLNFADTWAFESYRDLEDYIAVELSLMESEAVIELVENLSDDVWWNIIEPGDINTMQSTVAWMLRITTLKPTSAITIASKAPGTIASKAPGEEYTQEEVTDFFYGPQGQSDSS